MTKKIFAVLFAITIMTIAGFAQDYSAVTSQSKIKWEGKKVVGGHWGWVSIKSGSIKAEKGKPVSGNFIIDLNSIINEDLKDAETNAKLLGHLKSADFFNVEKYPEAKLNIKSIKSTKETDKYNLTADLTIKGITKQIKFPAVIKMSDNEILAKADFTIDRTKWDIRYNSGNFFKDLGDKMILDDIVFSVNLKASK